ncbi:MAG: YabP/YqfC family sporulation protein [Bacilli bacterium]|nr:YabP/YqfC family sporulation protein [Bacilli bacterium]MBO6194877.1 YabP/YqfC family sporulation protein [Bacilli bacterium]
MNRIKEYVRNSEFKITILNNKINIENYTNILDISDTKIQITNNNKKIKILGTKLQINKLLNNEILIYGKYNNIIFED